MKILASILGVLLCLAALPQSSVEAAAKRCMVVRRISGCDYFMVQTATDYAVLEWFGGHDPDKDDKLVGELGYGMKTFIYENSDRSVRVYVEEYGLNREDALDKLVEHCE